MDVRRLKMWSAGMLPVLAVAFLLSLVAEPAQAAVFRFTFRMTGAQEVPRVAPAGTATARITVNTITRAISGTVVFSGLTTPSMAGHIHLAAAGVNGPVIIPLAGGLRVRAGTMRVPPGTVLLPAQLTALRQSRLYVNIHTTAHIGGEIRGQIRFATRVVIASANQAQTLKVASGNLTPEQTGG